MEAICMVCLYIENMDTGMVCIMPAVNLNFLR